MCLSTAASNEWCCLESNADPSDIINLSGLSDLALNLLIFSWSLVFNCSEFIPIAASSLVYKSPFRYVLLSTTLAANDVSVGVKMSLGLVNSSGFLSFNSL